MIKTKSGQELKIISGNKKCITGNQPFTVQCVYPELTLEQMLSPVGQVAIANRNSGKFKLRKDELVFDSEDELYTAIGYKRI